MTTEEQSNTNVKETENWAEGWVKKDLISPSPFAQESITDEQLDSAINAALESPGVSAMIENAAADAAEDLNTELSKAGISRAEFLVSRLVTEASVSKSEFDTFVARVERAFKHAGFKF